MDAEKLADEVDGFPATAEEAEALAANLEFEAELPPVEALMAMARPENPRPDRYND